MDSEWDGAFLHFMRPVAQFSHDMNNMRWNIAAKTCAFYASIDIISILKPIHYKPLSGQHWPHLWHHIHFWIYIYSYLHARSVQHIVVVFFCSPTYLDVLTFKTGMWSHLNGSFTEIKTTQDHFTGLSFFFFFFNSDKINNTNLHEAVSGRFLLSISARS